MLQQGWAENGEVVAVHMMHDSLDPEEDDRIFLNKLRHLDTLRHRNIVRVVGYCYHTICELMPHTGRLLVVEKVCRAICFEYLHYGSLRDYLAGIMLLHSYMIFMRCNNYLYLFFINIHYLSTFCR